MSSSQLSLARDYQSSNQRDVAFARRRSLLNTAATSRGTASVAVADAPLRRRSSCVSDKGIWRELQRDMKRLDARVRRGKGCMIDMPVMKHSPHESEANSTNKSGFQRGQGTFSGRASINFSEDAIWQSLRGKMRTLDVLVSRDVPPPPMPWHKDWKTVSTSGSKKCNKTGDMLLSKCTVGNKDKFSLGNKQYARQASLPVRRPGFATMSDGAIWRKLRTDISQLDARVRDQMTLARTKRRLVLPSVNEEDYTEGCEKSVLTGSVATSDRGDMDCSITDSFIGKCIEIDPSVTGYSSESFLRSEMNETINTNGDEHKVIGELRGFLDRIEADACARGPSSPFKNKRSNRRGKICRGGSTVSSMSQVSDWDDFVSIDSTTVVASENPRRQNLRSKAINSPVLGGSNGTKDAESESLSCDVSHIYTSSETPGDVFVDETIFDDEESDCFAEKDRLHAVLRKVLANAVLTKSQGPGDENSLDCSLGFSCDLSHADSTRDGNEMPLAVLYEEEVSDDEWSQCS